MSATCTLRVRYPTSINPIKIPHWCPHKPTLCDNSSLRCFIPVDSRFFSNHYRVHLSISCSPGCAAGLQSNWPSYLNWYSGSNHGDLPPAAESYSGISLTWFSELSELAFSLPLSLSVICFVSFSPLSISNLSVQCPSVHKQVSWPAMFCEGFLLTAWKIYGTPRSLLHPGWRWFCLVVIGRITQKFLSL